MLHQTETETERARQAVDELLAEEDQHPHRRRSPPVTPMEIGKEPGEVIMKNVRITAETHKLIIQTAQSEGIPYYSVVDNAVQAYIRGSGRFATILDEVR